MPYRKTVGVSLKRAEYHETSQLITFYTRDFGKVSTIAKGARRPKGRFQGGIDLLTLSEITFLESQTGSLATLTEYTVKERFPRLREKLECFYAASFLAELMLLATTDADPHPEAYELLVSSLSALEDVSRPQELVLAFQLKLLDLVGMQPQLEACCLCTRRIEPRTDAHFQAQAGGILCTTCAREVDTLKVCAGTLAALKQLAKSPLKMLAKMRLSSKIINEAMKVLLALVAFSLGRVPVSSKYLSG